MCEDAPCCGCCGQQDSDMSAMDAEEARAFAMDGAGMDEDADESADADGDESMDGDHDSAMASAGFGTDEDYGYYGGDE